ncbi:MAG: hypothetical protein ACD_35C00131G0003, partial [uncultured bacterium]
RRYFWGGVTDCYMKKTLTENGSTEEVVQLRKMNSLQCRMSRLLGNILRAAGLSLSVTKIIHARIYVSYVIGWLFGIFRWRNNSVLSDES